MRTNPPARRSGFAHGLSSSAAADALAIFLGHAGGAADDLPEDNAGERQADDHDQLLVAGHAERRIGEPPPMAQDHQVAGHRAGRREADQPQAEPQRGQHDDEEVADDQRALRSGWPRRGSA